MNLLDWQLRLENHFKKLKDDRSSGANGRPIFALEHGLADHEVDGLQKSIRAHILKSLPDWDHRLAWIVYAAEFGYLYAGDEYWQTFEANSPGWQIHGDRYWIRKCFLDFHIHCGGARPSGIWATHFSIICWPITHAVLPFDLQRHLARILFDLRHLFSAELLASPRQLGDLIAARSLDTPSRFQQLAQAPLFLGQIAAALLLHQDGAASSLMLPSTLARIRKDLDKERRARTWLQSAREGAQQSLQFRSFSVGHALGDGSSQEAAFQGGNLCIEPQLILRPSDDRTWDLLVDLPDFSHIPVRFPELKDLLLNSRCIVAGSSGRFLARGRLMYGPQCIQLREWPGVSKPLLEFDQSLPGLRCLLETQCLLRPGPPWLFKLSSDGLAYELRTTQVSAGNKYIALVEGKCDTKDDPSISTASVNCSGIQALSLDLPIVMTEELKKSLAALGIHHAGTVHVWPAGVTPVRWDGEGAAEWLSTDRPILGIRADHPVESFQIQLDYRFMEVVPSAPGTPVFIELPIIDLGTHALRVTAHRADGDGAKESGALDITIRQPRRWTPGRDSQGALQVVMDPTLPTLEQIWEGQANIELIGPSSRKLNCSISLFRKGQVKPHFSKTIPPLSLPLDNVIWQSHFYRHFKEDRSAQNAYDFADSCVLAFNANELGFLSLTVEREFSPLRWAVRRAHSDYFIKILDDRGTEEELRVHYFEFRKPDVSFPVESMAFSYGDGYKARGGLYAAQSGECRRNVIIPSEVHSLKDLQITPQLLSYARTPQDVAKLVRILDLWTNARMTGDLIAMTLRRDILSILLAKIFRLICGDHWAEAEREFSELDAKESFLKIERILLNRLGKREEAAVAACIYGQIGNLVDSRPICRAEQLANLLKLHLHIPVAPQNVSSGPAHLGWLSEFALRLASCSGDFASWAGTDISGAISRLLEVPSIARAARFLVLTHSARRYPGTTEFRQLFEGWDW